MPRFLSLRAKLVLWVSIAVFVSAIMGGLFSWFSVRDRLLIQLENQFDSGMNSLQTSIMASIDTGIKSYLKGIAKAQHAQMEYMLLNYYLDNKAMGDAPDLEAQLTEFLETQRVGNTGFIFAVDCSDGANPFIAAHPDQNMKGVEAADMPALAAICKQRTGYFKVAEHDADLAQRHNYIWLGAFQQTNWVYAVSSGTDSFRNFVDFSDIRRTIKTASVGTTGKVFVVTRNGRILLHPTLEGRDTTDFIDVDTGMSFLAGPLGQIAATPAERLHTINGSAHYRLRLDSSDDVSGRYVKYQYLPDTGWLLGVEADEREIAGPLYVLTESLILTVIIVVIMVTALLLVVTRPMFAVISDVTQSAQRISDGDYDIELSVEVRGRNEIAVLARAFVVMKSRISEYARQQEKHRKELEQAVTDRTAELKEANAQLEQLSLTDALTGLENRRSFDKTLEAEFLRTGRSEKPLGLIMIDIDHFKAYNDNYGHPAGDLCLRHVAAIIRSTARRLDDRVFRYGGEEFSLIAIETDIEGMTSLAKSICRAVAEAKLPHAFCPNGHVTVSVGCGTGYYNGKNTQAELLTNADSALYTAKKQGRNQVHCHQPFLIPSEFSAS